MRLIERSKEHKKPLFILDISDLDVTTHGMIPTGNKKDLVEYEENLKIRKQLSSEKSKTHENFPYQTNHCILWAKSRFVEFFERIDNELRDFMEDPNKYFEDLAKQTNVNIESTNYILELIKEIFINQSLHNFADCVDIAVDLFIVTKTNRQSKIYRNSSESGSSDCCQNTLRTT